MGQNSWEEHVLLLCTSYVNETTQVDVTMTTMLLLLRQDRNKAYTNFGVNCYPSKALQ